MKKLIRHGAAAAALAVMAVAGLAVAGVHPALGGEGSDHRVTICHHVEGNGNTGNGFNIETVDKDSIVNVEGVLNGHALHTLDIIPAFPAGSDGPHEWGSYPGQGDASQIDNNCGAGETTTSTTTTTSTETTTTTTTNPCPTNDCGPGQHCTVEPCNPPQPPCPNGEPPIHGKDGVPGNDACNPCLPPVNVEKCPQVTTTSTTTTQPTESTTTTTTIEPTTESTTTESTPAPVTPTPTPPVKHKPPAKHQTPPPAKPHHPKPPPACPPGKPYTGKCGVQGSG